jgi:hypothetical protein
LLGFFGDNYQQFMQADAQAGHAILPEAGNNNRWVAMGKSYQQLLRFFGLKGQLSTLADAQAGHAVLPGPSDTNRLVMLSKRK